MKPSASIAKIFPLRSDWPRRHRRAAANSDVPFWPDLSSGYARETAAPVNPDNRPSRVLSEIALIFSAVGALILAVWLFLPVSP